MSNAKFRINIIKNPAFDPDDPASCEVEFVKDPGQDSNPASIDQAGTITISKKKGTAVDIAFRLADDVYSDYSFTKGSFLASSITSNTKGEFSIKNVKSGDRTLVVTDENDDGDTWSYTLTLFDTSDASQPPVVLDPMIKNTTMA
ncbi:MULTISPECIES: hypothetical protein [Microbulbifer]|uniref:hypothetical protein n=1 Tax=Microbulbifer TaxID=48073 RepID=UPI001E2BF669|nr:MULTISPECIES: hypothetical protein [Microbulbifer]UHQ55245.1 hypothetical protein LVE68_17310 [Microbulbifer sp. YPW16]